MSSNVENLASYQRCVGRIRSAWPAFLVRRSERLTQQVRYGTAAEKVAENILEDLFTQVLDWTLGDLNNQVRFAELLADAKFEAALPGHLPGDAGNQTRLPLIRERIKAIAVSA